MALNNTPFTFNNKTEFVPAKPPEEKKMSTYDYLNNAESELRNALKSSVDLSQSYELRKLVDTIETVEQIKNQHRYSVTENRTVQDGFFHRENFEDMYGDDRIKINSSYTSLNSPDQIILG